MRSHSHRGYAIHPTWWDDCKGFWYVQIHHVNGVACTPPACPQFNSVNEAKTAIDGWIEHEAKEVPK